MDERLLSRLRCPLCHSSLSLKDQILMCSGCQETYSIYNKIPRLLKLTEIQSYWQNYFDERIEKKGDSLAANSYLNQGHFRLLQQTVLKVTGNIKDLMIIDVGCGTGHFSFPLVTDNYLVGLDLSHKMLQAAQAKGFHPIQASALEPPLADNSFDLVLANSIIQCLADAEKFLAELVRICIPRGRIIISAFNSQNIFFRILHHLEPERKPSLFLHPLKKIIKLLSKQKVGILGIYLLFYPLKFKKKFINFRKLQSIFLFLASSFVIEAKKIDSSFSSDAK